MGLRLKAIQEQTAEKERRLAEAASEVGRKEDELRHVTEELERNEGALAQANRQIAEKTRQSQSLMQMLHKAEMEESASDVIASVAEAAKGKRMLAPDEWKQFFSAVDELYPISAPRCCGTQTSSASSRCGCAISCASG